MSLVQLRDQWGADYFRTCAPTILKRLPVRTIDKEILTDIGLPVLPEESLCLSMRFEVVNIIHEPNRIRLLTDCEIEKGEFFPKSDHWLNFMRHDFAKFVVIGEAPNTFEKGGSFYFNRYVCIDCRSNGVFWVSTKLRDNRNVLSLLNTSLSSYLQSLLAYKEFRDQWERLDKEIDREQHNGLYEEKAWKIHGDFLTRLKQVDQKIFDNGFWKCHAMNETILMEIG